MLSVAEASRLGVRALPPEPAWLRMFPPWMDAAACVDPPEGADWFPVRGRGRVQAEAARAVCAGCPVREPCLEYAVADPTIVGIWGGTGGFERAALRRARRAEAAA